MTFTESNIPQSTMSSASSIAQLNGASSSEPSSTVPSDVSEQVDLLAWLRLYFWPALTLAIQNGWGGSPQQSSDKRDWLAGEVSSLITTNQLQDNDDLAEVLLQVMNDEFGVVIDDGSVEETAKSIWLGAGKIAKGETAELQELYAKWQEKEKKGGIKVVGEQLADQEGAETDNDEDEISEEEWNGFEDRKERGDADMDLDEAPALVDSRKKPEPEVDEEGFTKVVGKKKR